MASLFDIGKSGVQSYRQALAVTGQNIANINTDGYHRREASIEEVSASQGGLTAIASQVGLGARVSDIRRSFNEFTTNRVYATSAEFERANAYYQNVKDLENYLLPSESDLGNHLGNFFGSLMEMATAPGDIPPRMVALEEGRNLAGAFRQTALVVDGLKDDALAQANADIDAVNLLATELVKINQRLMSSGQSGQAPNSVLDNRDQVITEISRLVEMTVSYDNRGVATLALGNTSAGPKLVEAANSTKLGIVENEGSIQPALVAIDGNIPTGQITKGSLAGYVDSYKFIANTEKSLDNLAYLVAREFNMVHRGGINMDGNAGDDMFSLTDARYTFSPANRSVLSAEINVTDPEIVPPGQINFVYNDTLNKWVSEDISDFPDITTTSSQIFGSGFNLTILGAPQNGDSISIDNVSGAAANMQFLLRTPQEFAAAARTLVSQDVANTSDAILDVQIGERLTPGVPASVADVFEDGNSPLNTTAFLRDGVVAAIPAGTQSVSINSYKQQASANFTISIDNLMDASNLEIVLADGDNAGTHNFALNYGTVFPNAEASDNWTDEAEFQRALALGAIVSDGGLSIADLGLFPSSVTANLRLASADATITSARITTSLNTVDATVTSAQDASEIQIFTREGRHIAGSPMSDAEIANYLTAENGFSAEAEYYGNYLNQETNAYRNMGLNLSHVGGLEVLRMSTNGLSPEAIAGYTTIPDSPAEAFSLTATVANGNTSLIDVPAGASARYLAEMVNDGFNQHGIVAKAATRVQLKEFSADGAISFNLESENQEPLNISATISTGNLSNLVDAVNNKASLTGVSAELNETGDQLILISEEGRDIMISGVTADSPNFKAEVISSFPAAEAGRVLSSTLTVNVDDGNGTVDAARFTGEVVIDSAAAFQMTAGIGYAGNTTTTTFASDEAPMAGGMVDVVSSANGDVKTLRFDANGQVDDNLGGSDTLAFAASATYSLELPAETNSQTFTASVTSGELAAINPASVAEALVSELRSQATTISFSSFTGQAEDDRPVDGDSLVVEFDGDQYTVTMTDGELVVSGGEEGRLTAYYDQLGYFNIAAGGSLLASQITIPGDDTVVNNGDAAIRFGITDSSLAGSRYAGLEIDAATTNGSFTVSFEGVDITLTLAADGTLTHNPATDGFVAAFNISTGTTGRLVLGHNIDTGPISFPADNTAKPFGFQVSDYGLKLDGADIHVTSSQGSYVDLTATATSLADRSVTMTNLPNEDLIVMVTGGGARSISATYDIAPPVSMFEEVDIVVTGDDGNTVEVYDALTGHSIASRTLDELGQTNVYGYELNFSGVPAADDVFHLIDNSDGIGDARNLDAMLQLQEKDLLGENSGSFNDIFAAIVTGVGSSVRSSEMGLQASEAMRDAAVEAELGYSGVNLDEEAASLLEYQQAYQASARILSTARDLFDTLLQVI